MVRSTLGRQLVAQDSEQRIEFTRLGDGCLPCRNVSFVFHGAAELSIFGFSLLGDLRGPSRVPVSVFGGHRM